MQVLDSRGGVVRDVPVSAFDPATGLWDAAGAEGDGLPRDERVPLEDVARELGREPDELAAYIMSVNPRLITSDWGGRAWLPARALQTIRRDKQRQRELIAARTEIANVAEATQGSTGTGADDDG